MNGATLNIQLSLFDDAGQPLDSIKELEILYKYATGGPTQLSTNTFSPSSPIIVSPMLSGGAYTFSIPNFQAPAGMMYFRFRGVSFYSETTGEISS